MGDLSLGCITKLDMHLHLTFFAGKSADLPCKAPLEKGKHYSQHATKCLWKSISSFIINIFYSKLLTFSFARDFIEKMMTSQWYLKEQACLRSRDWEFRMEVILIQTRLDVGSELTELWNKMVGKENECYGYITISYMFLYNSPKRCSKPHFSR